MNFRVLKNDEMIWYQRKEGNKFYDIIFDLEEKTISCELSNYNEKGTLIKKQGIMSVEILQVIYKQAKELGWIE